MKTRSFEVHGNDPGLKKKASLAHQIHELAESPELKGCNSQSILTFVGIIILIVSYISFLNF